MSRGALLDASAFPALERVVKALRSHGDVDGDVFFSGVIVFLVGVALATTLIWPPLFEFIAHEGKG